ncbi:hypothetical protein MHYP_G00295040 [Metynnis hypsauchen]
MIGEYRVVKFFMMVFGNALYSHIHFIDQLTACLHLREVVSEEESDIIIAFVAVSSRAGTDIEAALQGIPQTSRPVVLVVLHHTFDPFFVAPDSRLSVDRNDMLTVDCLFHEDKGLLRCERNQVALKAVTDHLISKGALAWPQEGFKSFLPWRGFTHIIQTRQKIILQDNRNDVWTVRTVWTVDCPFHEDQGPLRCLHNKRALNRGGTTSRSAAPLQAVPQQDLGGACLNTGGGRNDPAREKQRRLLKSAEMVEGSRVVNFFMMVFGNTLYSHIHFMDRLTTRLELHEVTDLEKSHSIIAFVVVASRAGTNLEAALRKIPQSSRPAVLVVLHHTFDPNFIAPDSRLSVNRPDVFTVDCLFYEDQGLLRCLRNDEALKAVTDHLISKGGLPKSQEGFNLPLLMNHRAVNQFCTRKTRNLWIIFGLVVGAVFGVLLGFCNQAGQVLLGAPIGALAAYLLHFHISNGKPSTGSLTSEQL